ncbi:MAG: hypothetical protein NTW29_01335 [Bacteroidetes bacterium]|nr:hypothetical protein [Bacteroidota bacterium]
MKKILYTTIFLLAMLDVRSQFNTNIVVSPQAPGSIFNWGTKDMTYLVSSPAGLGRRVVIKASFKTLDGTVVGTTNLANARVINLTGGNQLFYAADVIPADIMVFSGKYKVSLDKTGKLPSDNYQLCVQLVTPIDYLPVSEERCRTFNLAAFQLSIPVMPANDMVLDTKLAQTYITFRWTPVTPRPVFPVTYRILVFEVLANQQPVQALRSNQPLLDKAITGTTQFIWQPQLGMMDLSAGVDSVKTSKQFIWTIQALDQQGKPISDGNVNGDGVSEPAIFRVGKKEEK